MTMPVTSLTRERALPWRVSQPVPVDAKWSDVWLTVTPIWAVLAACRVAFYELERLRFPQDVPPVVADAIQGLLLYPLVVLGCYLTIRIWRRTGLTRAAVTAALSAIVFGMLARPAYAVGSLLNSQDSAAREWLSAFRVPSLRSYVYPWLSNTLEYSVLYLSCMAVMVGYFSYVGLRHERQARALVRAEADQERLRTLRAQLNPHFLFNSLNSIVSLSDTQPAAQLLLTQLSDLLRRTLRASEQEEHQLFEELTFVEEYFDIELTRQPGRIDWRITVDPGCARAAVPALLLLPLVENSVTHGRRGGAQSVAIDINVWRARHQLFIHIGNTCADNLPSRDVTRTGVGLRNVQSRIEMLFGTEASFQAGRTDNGRFEVQISLPLRELRVRSFDEDEPCAL
jgi:hypothetical protein